MSLSSASTLIAAGVAAGAPLALAALGGLFTEAAGSLSVALEGAMLAGAFAASLAASGSGSLGLALIAAVLAGALIGLLVGFAATRLRADVFVAGLAANILVPGLVSILSERLFGTKGVLPVPALAGTELGSAGTAFGRGGAALDQAAKTLSSSGTELGLAELGLADIPVLGPALFGQPPFVYLLFLAVAALWLVYAATPFGLRLRAAGERGEAARAAGLDRERLRIGAHLVAGAASGLAGAALAVQIAAFVPGMSAGRGWIALVAVYLGGRRPGGVIAACIGFGLLLALSNAAQALVGAPAELILALPYLLTAAALVAGRAARKKD